MDNYSYKEFPPKATIQRAEEILHRLGIQFQAKIYNPFPHVYSASLVDRRHGWSVNGKGTSEELSLSSAFGEAMERLQNPFFTYSKFECDQESLDYRGFYYFPDEQTAPMEMILKQCRDVKADMESAFAASDHHLPNELELRQLWESLLKDDCEETGEGEDAAFFRDRHVILLPYYSVRRGRLRFMPEGIIRRLCGTNGLCAGNTPCEALCQGLSELFERYVKRLIFTQQLTPPLVPDEYLDRVCPTLKKEISMIERASSCKILVWDCSLGRGYPVAACCLIDNAHHAYRIKFGAHPVFRTALERCITEMLQGFAHFSQKDMAVLMTHWTKEEQIKWNYAGNVVKGFYYDCQSVPNSMFFPNSSWKFKPWANQKNFTNQAGVHRMLSALLKISSDICIRDHSYLGFPAYRIYAPGISAIGMPYGIQSCAGERLAKQLLSPKTLANGFTHREKRTLIGYLSENCPSGFSIHGLPVDLVISALYADMGEYGKAALALDRIANAPPMIVCAKREWELRDDGYAEADRDYMLELFFPQEAVRAVQTHFRAENVLYALFSETRSVNLTRKSLENSAKRTRIMLISKLHKELKSYMCINAIYQEKIPSKLDIIT